MIQKSKSLSLLAQPLLDTDGYQTDPKSYSWCYSARSDNILKTKEDEYRNTVNGLNFNTIL